MNEANASPEPGSSGPGISGARWAVAAISKYSPSSRHVVPTTTMATSTWRAMRSAPSRSSPATSLSVRVPSNAANPFSGVTTLSAHTSLDPPSPRLTAEAKGPKRPTDVTLSRVRGSSGVPLICSFRKRTIDRALVLRASARCAGDCRMEAGCVERSRRSWKRSIVVMVGRMHVSTSSIVTSPDSRAVRILTWRIMRYGISTLSPA